MPHTYMFTFSYFSFHGFDIGLHPLGAVLELSHVLIAAGFVLNKIKCNIILYSLINIPLQSTGMGLKMAIQNGLKRT